MDKQLFKDAMRHLAATVNVISTDGDAGRNGITATAVTSLSDTPPSLLVSVNKNGEFHDQVLKNKKFSVHILREDMSEISNCFAGYKGFQGEEKFQLGTWDISDESRVLENALANIECELTEAHDGFTHSIFIGKITDIKTTENHDDKPLLYSQGQYTTVQS
ncbi:flavin reductase family protein [Flammeovirga sp. EKP202]|uniref:flavin reductase family protein n=1 Tax=Flammeovirga sp. EKP202 TaxID=2770592 RepID=UPI00165F238C|nr:flavin reductase family protein [Flammeovirga sp. EKP202]MBD0401336.1 flavin reductase [Flammeovirga sp. EKP202]